MCFAQCNSRRQRKCLGFTPLKGKNPTWQQVYSDNGKQSLYLEWPLTGPGNLVGLLICARFSVWWRSVCNCNLCALFCPFPGLLFIQQPGLPWIKLVYGMPFSAEPCGRHGHVTQKGSPLEWFSHAGWELRRLIDSELPLEPNAGSRARLCTCEAFTWIELLRKAFQLLAFFLMHFVCVCTTGKNVWLLLKYYLMALQKKRSHCTAFGRYVS